MKSFCFKLELLKIYYLDLKKVIFETTHVRVMKFCGPLQSVWYMLGAYYIIKWHDNIGK